jgi:3-oxoacyl-[acyl-carrier-protein] synthase-3
MDGIKILGTGSCVPPKVLTNFDLQKMGLDTTDEWIASRTGVRERRIAEPDVNTSDLAKEASLKALEMAELTAKDLDLIIVGTITPDTCCPAAANWLQAKLKAPQAVTFDVTAACSGFIFGLNVATQYLLTGYSKTVLVVGAEIMSRTLNWKDRTTCILWGDGAGAAILTNGKGGHQLLSTHVHTDGENGQDLLLPGGGSRTTPISHESVDKELQGCCSSLRGIDQRGSRLQQRGCRRHQMVYSSSGQSAYVSVHGQEPGPSDGQVLYHPA